jgi:tetratricopeptide (TPR) repeat protein
MGIIYSEQGDYDTAFSHYKEALKIRTAIGHKYGIATTQNNIANIHSRLGDHDTALRLFHESLITQKNIGNRVGIANTLNNISNMQFLMGSYKKALNSFEQIYQLFSEIGHRYGMISCKSNIGRIYFYLGELDKAFDFMKEAEKTARQIDSKKLIVQCLNDKAELYIQQNNCRKAQNVLEESLTLCEEGNLKSDIPVTLSLFAQAVLEGKPTQKNRKKADKYLTRAVKSARECKEKAVMCRVLLHQIKVYHLCEEFRKARKTCKDALTLIRNENVQYLLPEILYHTGSNYIHCGKTTDGVSHLQEAKSLAEQRGQCLLLQAIKKLL